MSEKLLEISGLSVCYEGEQILNNICFSVEKRRNRRHRRGVGQWKKYLAASDPAADGKEWFHHRRADHISRRGADGHVRKEAAESVRFRNWYDFPEYRGITLSDPENRSTDL